MQMPSPMPMPAGTPIRLPAEVAGSLSRLQGQLMAAQPDIQNAYAMHWLAMRQAGAIPAFQPMTQQMLWGLYGTTAMSGLLRQALSGRATPEVLAGIIDQVNLVQRSYTQAAESLREFLETPETRDFPTVQPMVQSFRPLDQVYQAVQQPMQTVTTTLSWNPGAPLPLVQFPMAELEWRPETTED